jgi:hypothetical protein
MTDEPDERSERRNAFVRSFLATALVAAAHVTAFAWLTSHGLSTEPPDSVLGNPIELDLLAVAPPEPSHEVAPARGSAPSHGQSEPGHLATPHPLQCRTSDKIQGYGLARPWRGSAWPDLHGGQLGGSVRLAARAHRP